jgi:hypothetical protein
MKNKITLAQHIEVWTFMPFFGISPIGIMPSVIFYGLLIMCGIPSTIALIVWYVAIVVLGYKIKAYT